MLSFRVYEDKGVKSQAYSNKPVEAEFQSRHSDFNVPQPIFQKGGGWERAGRQKTL